MISDPAKIADRDKISGLDKITDPAEISSSDKITDPDKITTLSCERKHQYKRKTHQLS